MISVLMSVFARDDPAYLELSLASLVAQQEPPQQTVVVRDGPVPPELESVIAQYGDQLNITDVYLASNAGLGAALQAGLAKCTEDYVARLDADDIALPDRLRLQIEAFRSDPSLDVVSGFAIEIDPDGEEDRIRKLPVTHDHIVSTLWANPVIHPAVMFRRERVISIGGYDPALRRRQDYELWFRCAKMGLRFGNVAQPVIKYRFSPDTHTRQSFKQMWQQGIIGYKGSRSLGLPQWKQLACFVPFARSLLPSFAQHHIYRLMQKFDPRSS